MSLFLTGLVKSPDSCPLFNHPGAFYVAFHPNSDSQDQFSECRSRILVLTGLLPDILFNPVQHINIAAGRDSIHLKYFCRRLGFDPEIRAVVRNAWSGSWLRGSWSLPRIKFFSYARRGTIPPTDSSPGTPQVS